MSGYSNGDPRYHKIGRYASTKRLHKERYLVNIANDFNQVREILRNSQRHEVELGAQAAFIEADGANVPTPVFLGSEDAQVDELLVFMDAERVLLAKALVVVF
jgi:hypothetical protein